MFSVFLSSYRSTWGSLRELKKAEETLTCRLVFPQYFSFSQTSTRVSNKQLPYELSISITYRNQEQIIQSFSINLLVVQNSISFLFTNTSKTPRSGRHFVNKGTLICYPLSVTE